MYAATYTSLYQSLKTALTAVDSQTSLMVGIHTGGYWLAEQLHAELGFALPLAALSTTLQRDDFATTGLHKQRQPSRLPMSLQGADVLLVDDVLHTGRTLRAALNELFEFGRPARVRLAVLVDRGGRQLPFAADFCGGRVDVAAQDELVLARDTDSNVLTLKTYPRRPV
jgi:pyrimidine operon attenuation protein / uracil phosphoribosyltransferase